MTGRIFFNKAYNPDADCDINTEAKGILLRNVRLSDNKSELPCDIHIEDGVITAIGCGLSADGDEYVLECSGLTAIPGLFDMHVHLRDPGLTHKEDVLTGCAAALAGGVTGVACMPNTIPPTDNAQTVRYIIDKSAGTGVSVYPAGCITSGMEGGRLCDFDELSSAGVRLISDDGRPVKNAELMRSALEQTNSNGLLAVSHCEDLDIIDGGIINKGRMSAKLNAKGMDRASEDSITAREIMLAASCGARVHICHVSTRGSMAAVRAAKAEGARVTCETCPHYFFYTEDKLEGMDADYRMNPPLREESDRQAVIRAVLDGTVDCIVTDHAPHTSEEKSDFYKAPNGVVGLETSLSATLTAFYHTGLLSLERIVALMSANPRQLLGIPEVKIAVGEKAEIALVDLNAEWTVIPEELHSKSKNSVFKQERLKGRVAGTVSHS